MKRFIIYIIIFIILCSVSNYSIDYVQGKQIKEQSPYYLSFASIGAIYLESRLDCWAKIRTASTTEELQDYLHNILKSLDMNLDPKILNITSTDTTTILDYELSRPEQNIIITLKSNKQLNESYFMLSVICQDQKICLDEYESKLNKIIGLKWQFYYLYTGELPQMIAFDDHNKMITVLLKTMKAQRVETYSNKEISSITAYSPQLEGKVPGLNINGKRYNLQIATRNNKDKTDVYIGSPLILGEY